MLTIGGEKHTLSETVVLLKTAPSVWHKQCLCYLLKIDRSGSTSFATLSDLQMRLAGYLMDKKAPAPLDGPTPNSAMCLEPIQRTQVLKEDVEAIKSLMTRGKTGISNESPHQSDPETGRPKGPHVTVTEYYVNGADGRRATKRTEQGKVTYYYSATHNFNGYQYRRLL